MNRPAVNRHTPITIPPTARGGRAVGTTRPVLVAIDGWLPAADDIVAALTVPAHIVRIDPARDGLAQLVAAAQAVPGRPLVVICHGDPGALALGNRPVTAATVAGRRDELAELGRALAGAPIELYACSVAEGRGGRAFVAALERATGCPVAAAGGPVGGTALGGSWVLDAGRPAARPAIDAAALANLPVLLVVDRTWKGGTGNWNDADNWDPDTVPANSATIDNGGTAQVAGTAHSVIYVSVGRSGTGALQVTGGGTLTSNAMLFIGRDAGSSGTVLVDGAGSAVRFGGSSGAFNYVGDEGTGSLTVSNGATAFFGYIIRVGYEDTGNGTLTVSGGGKLTADYVRLGDAGTGTLNIGDGGAAGILSTSGVVGGNFGGSGTVNFNHTDAGYVFSSDGTGGGTATAIVGAAVVNQIGTGTTILTGANTYTGGTTISAGTLQVGNGGTAGSITGNVTNNATLAFDRANDLTYSGVVSGTGTVVKDGAGTLTLSGTNTYSGGTTISAGTLQVGAGGTSGSIAGDVVNNGTLAFDRADDLAFSGVISGSGGLTKTGAGVLTLSGSNTYAGTTTVSAGTLRLEGGDAIADDATVHVAAGATLDLNGTTETIGALTGSGTVTTGIGGITLFNPGASSFSGSLIGTGIFSVASGVTLSGTGTYSMSVEVLSGATIAPGNSPGTIAPGNLTLASGSTAIIEIDGTTAGTHYDQIAVTGSVTIGSSTLETVFGHTSITGDSFVLIANDGADPVTGSFAGLAEGATFNSGGRVYRISYAGSDGNDVTLTDAGAVPAPDSAGGGGSNSGTAQRLVGGAGSETLPGTDGADTISAMAGDDRVYAGAGGDIAYGNQDADTLWGNTGADTLYGGQQADILYGNQEGDVLYGNLGADTAFGGQDADTVFGGEGVDVLYGNLGDDRLFGNLGSDTLYGGQGADTLSGGAGDDLLAGGLGADRHAFGSGDGADTIAGFSAAEGDVIAVAANINGTGIASAFDLLAQLTADANGDVVLDLGSGNTVTLMGVPATGTSADWFTVV